MKKNTLNTHFEAHAKEWISGGYDGDGYVYPTAFHRTRIVNRILEERRTPDNQQLTVADLGCGGGHLAIKLASQGHKVSGIDQAESMIQIAKQSKKDLPRDVRNNVTFHCRDLELHDFPKETFDVVTSMGLIGYLENDDILFGIARQLLKPGGLFIVSCRNRLFNLNCLSFRTRDEIRNAEAEDLIDEIFDYYQTVPSEDAVEMLERFRSVANTLPSPENSGSEAAPVLDSPAGKISDAPAIEARQHTPRRLREVGLRHGMTPKGEYGVHPHLIDPNSARLLPPEVFNTLSSCLEALEHLPVSLVWSSVFLSVFEKDD